MPHATTKLPPLMDKENMEIGRMILMLAENLDINAVAEGWRPTSI